MASNRDASAQKHRSISAEYLGDNPFEGDDVFQLGDFSVVLPGSRLRAVPLPNLFLRVSPGQAAREILLLDEQFSANARMEHTPLRGPPLVIPSSQALVGGNPNSEAAVSQSLEERQNFLLPPMTPTRQPYSLEDPPVTPECRHSPSSIYSDPAHDNAFVELASEPDMTTRSPSPIPLLSRGLDDSPARTSSSGDPFRFDSAAYSKVLASSTLETDRTQPRAHNNAGSTGTKVDDAVRVPVYQDERDSATEPISAQSQAIEQSGLVKPRNDAATDADWQTVTTDHVGASVNRNDNHIGKGTGSSIADVSDPSEYEYHRDDFGSTDRIISVGPSTNTEVYSTRPNRPRSYNLLAAEFADGEPGPALVVRHEPPRPASRAAAAVSRFSNSVRNPHRWMRPDAQTYATQHTEEQADNTYVSLGSEAPQSEISEPIPLLQRDPDSPGLEREHRELALAGGYDSSTPTPTHTPTRRNRDFTIDSRFTPVTSPEEAHPDTGRSDPMTMSSPSFQSPNTANTANTADYSDHFNLISLIDAARIQQHRREHGEEDHTLEGRTFASLARSRTASQATVPQTPVAPFPIITSTRSPGTPETVWFPSLPETVRRRNNNLLADEFVDIDLNDDRRVPSSAILGGVVSHREREPTSSRIIPKFRKISDLFRFNKRRSDNSNNTQDTERAILPREDVEMLNLAESRVPPRVFPRQSSTPPLPIIPHRRIPPRNTSRRNFTSESIPSHRPSSDDAIRRQRIMYRTLFVIDIAFPLISLFALFGLFDTTISWVTKGEMHAFTQTQRRAFGIKFLLEIIGYTIIIIAVAISKSSAK
ncbi:hypothetical protein PT974_06157 [Cladobotryum mycophilum]|uniref:Uncharacterized protein n=1 Tax=Cladobotryum mycophilum TaxID=491253 RepID=A0ABR0SKP7_9HYPO